MTRLLLIRHALTDFVGKRISGRTPGISLNDEGRKQVSQLVANLSFIHIDAVVSSPLERATETAFPIAEAHGLECIVSDEFIEIDYGKWTNLEIDEIKKDPDFRRYNSFRSISQIPGGERTVDSQNRILSGIGRLCHQFPDKTVAVVTHADLIRSAAAFYLGMPLDLLLRIEISPASVSIIRIDNEFIQVTLLNYKGKQLSF
jgi:probable phosphoglycerate mutase